jgi:hypothetical protein
MTRQPSGDSLLIDRVPTYDRAFTLRYEKQIAQAKKEGPKQCSAEDCPSNLRAGNRDRGICDACWRKKQT